MATLSPMMQQYLDIKAAHKDHVLFFRLGDFYEMFFDDAVNISKELELTLTGRDCGLPERAPMCGIPFHSAEGYIKKLIEKGYKVAICEQLEDPAAAKGLVKRDVIRVITPGTVIESSFLNEERNNYIASVIAQAHGYAVCFCDISTGDTYLTERQTSDTASDIIDELSRFLPSELLLNETAASLKPLVSFLQNRLSCVCETLSEEDVMEDACKEIIESHFERSVKEIEAVQTGASIAALGTLIRYVASTQKDGAKRITSVRFYEEDAYMTIDMMTRRNLELTETMRAKEKKGTLLWVLDHTKTAMGKRYMRKAVEQPLYHLTKILRRQNAVKAFVENELVRGQVASALCDVYDLERLMTRVLYGTINPREMKALSYTLSKLPAIKTALSVFESGYLKELCDRIDPLGEVHALIENALVEEPPVSLKDGGVINTGFSDELDEYRALRDHSKEYIAQIEAREREKTGIKTLKVGYNRVFGYYIDVTKSYLSQVPETYIRKQTLANSERYITEELKELEHKVLTATERITALEAEIFEEVRRFVAQQSSAAQATAEAIARVDFLLSLAQVAAQQQYVCPELTMDGVLRIRNGRHPVVEQMLVDQLFVPNDTTLDAKNNLLMMLTGPNMAGKSTYMRQVALIVIMAQIGSFVPAQEAQIGLCDRVFTRVGASDDLSAGQSTFMVEMNEVAHILRHATPSSLVILDEIGRGTSTFDGMSIAKAVAAEIVENKKLRCKTLFATHYHELIEMESQFSGVKNYNIAVKKRGDDITFLRKIVPGGADESYGIEVAKLAGVPERVVSRAKVYLRELSEKTPVCTEKRSPEPAADLQVSLFEQAPSPVCDALRAISIETLTPIEALNKLYALKQMIGETE